MDEYIGYMGGLYGPYDELPDTPQGFTQADHIAWNFPKRELLDYLTVNLPEGPHYKVLILEDK